MVAITFNIDGEFTKSRYLDIVLNLSLKSWSADIIYDPVSAGTLNVFEIEFNTTTLSFFIFNADVKPWLKTKSL